MSGLRFLPPVAEEQREGDPEKEYEADRPYDQGYNVGAPPRAGLDSLRSCPHSLDRAPLHDNYRECPCHDLEIMKR